MADVIPLSVAIALLVNLLMAKTLGQRLFTGTSIRADGPVGLILMTTALLLIATGIEWIVVRPLLSHLGLQNLRALALVVLVVAVANVGSRLQHRLPAGAQLRWMRHLPLSVVNATMLGVGLLMLAPAEGLLLALGQVLVSATGLGMALLAYAGARARVLDDDLPAPLRGLPIAGVIVGILALTLHGVLGPLM